MLTDPTLAGLPGIGHGFMTRQGGVSGGVFASLNCGLGSGDDDDRVRQNRARALDRLGAGTATLLTARQVHSPDVLTVTEAWDDDRRPELDGLVTNRAGLALGILSADCAPVLFADAEAGVIGGAHAGWKGALHGVLESTLAAMTDLGARPERMAAAIGPTIGVDSYEVDDGFRDRHLETDADSADFFGAGRRPGHHQFDLPGYIGHRLAKAGVGTVRALDRDTYGEEDLFFSYRRACHRSEGDYGRLLSVIMLR